MQFEEQLPTITAPLRGFALKLHKDAEDANDLLQETLYKAFSQKDKFQEGSNLSAWLHTIMRNTFINNYRKTVRQQTFIDRSENSHFINNQDTISITDATSELNYEELIRQIDSLEEMYSKPFLMYFKGFKYQEIAKTLEIPEGTVKNRIHTARKILKAKILRF